MTEKKEEYNTYAILARKTNPYALDTRLAPVDWREARERFDPQGVEIPAKDLISATFTIVDLRPCNSSYNEGDIFYYVKAVRLDSGELFHTSLGGQAVVEILNGFHELNTALLQARETGDKERAAMLEDIGGGRPITVTLGWKAQGAFSGYYTLE